ncbi:MAG TPA: hypothetical protein VE736_09060 [Gaiellaceae bacterium]|nr:hypothetical protein [Gaiellaceae bacterium]
MADTTRLDTRILALLDEHGSLGYDEIATQLDEPPDAIRASLTELRDLGFVDAVTVDELELHVTRAAVSWRLTDQGREQLAHP